MRLMHPARDAPVRREEAEIGVRADGRPLVVDLTRPADGEGPWPIVVLIHGAAPDSMGLPFRESDLFRDWGRVLGSRGLAALMLDHTLGWPALRLDQALGEIDQALAWLAQGGAALGIDASRLGAVVASAGALLAGELFCGARPLRPRAGALFSPLLAAPRERPAIPGERADTLERTNLASFAPALALAGTRLALFRAGGDASDRLAAFDAAVLALLAADVDVDIRTLPGAPHAFEAVADEPRTH